MVEFFNMSVCHISNIVQICPIVSSDWLKCHIEILHLTYT